MVETALGNVERKIRRKKLMLGFVVLLFVKVTIATTDVAMFNSFVSEAFFLFFCFVSEFFFVSWVQVETNELVSFRVASCLSKYYN